jgi:hypothetical protein
MVDYSMALKRSAMSAGDERSARSWLAERANIIPQGLPHGARKRMEIQVSSWPNKASNRVCALAHGFTAPRGGLRARQPQLLALAINAPPGHGDQAFAVQGDGIR